MLLALAYTAMLIVVARYIAVRLGLFVTARGCLLGWMWIVLGPPHLYYWAAGKIEGVTYERITCSFLIMWVAMLAGMEVTRLAGPRQFARAEALARRWRDESVAPGYISKTMLTVICSVGLVFMAFISATEHQVGHLAEFISLQGQTDEIARIRGTVGGSHLYLYNLLLYQIAPFLSLMLLLRPARRLPLYTALRYGFIGIVVLGKAAMLNRSGLVLYLTQLLLVKALLKDNRLRFGRLVGVVALVAILVFPAFYHYLGDLPIGRFITVYFLDRVFMAPYYGMINYFSLYPDLAPHALGRNISVINWFWYHGEAYTPPMVRFAQEAGNIYGSFNAGFVAEAWADFGYWGVFVTSLIAGSVAAMADFVVFGDGVKTREAAAILTCVVFGVLTLSATATQTALFSGGFALIPLIGAFLKLLARARPTHRLARRAVPSGPLGQPRATS